MFCLTLCSIWGIWPFFVCLFKAPELSHFFLSDKAPVSTEFRHFRAFLTPSGPLGPTHRSVLVHTCDPSTQGRGWMISGLGSLGYLMRHPQQNKVKLKCQDHFKKKSVKHQKTPFIFFQGSISLCTSYRPSCLCLSFVTQPCVLCCAVDK